MYNQLGKEIGKPRKSGGYRQILFTHLKTKESLSTQVHRLVWAVYKGVPKDPELEINHIDGIKANCRLANLELCTSRHNNIHARELGLVKDPVGYERPNALFTNLQVERYRKLFTLGRISRDAIRIEHSCSHMVVTSMLLGRTYKHVVTKYDDLCKYMIENNPHNRRK